MGTDLREKQEVRTTMQPIELPARKRGQVWPFVAAAVAVAAIVVATVVFVTADRSTPFRGDVTVLENSLAGIREQGPYAQAETGLSPEAIENSFAAVREQGPYAQAETGLSPEAIENSLSGAREQGPYEP